jgi:hypothetical protein
MKKITTYSGTHYILDEDNKRINRFSSGSAIESMLRGFLYGGRFTPYENVAGLSEEESGGKTTNDIQTLTGKIEVGKRLAVWYGSSRDMPWSLSTEIASIEELAEDALL